MFNDIIEFFFCPVHGVLRPQMWPFIGAGIIGARAFGSQVVTYCRENPVSEWLFCQIHGIFRHRNKQD